MKYVMRALVTGKHSFGRKVLHFVTVVAAAMLFLNSPEWGGKCWFGMFLPVLVCCTLTSQKKNKPLFAVLFLPNEYLSYSKHNTADTNKPVNILIQSAYPRLNDVAPTKSFSIYIAYPAEP